MKTKTIEELREDSKRMRTLGTAAAAASIVGAALAGAVSVPLAAVVVGATGAAVSAVSLFRKLTDDRAMAQRLGNQPAAPRQPSAVSS